ncbi:amidohydrolase family protein [Kribbella qitaiheensis]|uniref:Amidohydrolase family protein n=2 Tax=Kribbella qitaiheensis TaxID=1544730 RepID=A0A7G6X8T7_9ACTN|nr:amidohydrolase family protein [Kribbella qitaiheensis]
MRMSESVVLRGGALADARLGPEPVPGDLRITDGRVATVGAVEPEPGERVVDCSGRFILPGLIDAHSHADAAVFDDEVSQALLRQGVTAVIAGQDGVSFAPGDGRYATRYFAAINGAHPSYRGGGVAALLDGYGHTTPINVGYLIPAGTVRESVCGLSAATPTLAQLRQMRDLVASGMGEGALGLSTGLDYVPGCFADVDELAALCAPVAARDGLYVTHMRGGYEENSRAGLDEVASIARASEVRAHVSHFHARSELIVELVEEFIAAGVDLSFDSYPYSRGCTILAMLVLPPAFLRNGFDSCVAELGRPEVGQRFLAEWIPIMAARADMGPNWADNIRFAHIAADSYRWAHGLTPAAAAGRLGISPAELVLQVLAEADLEVSVIMRVPKERNDAEMAGHLKHPAHMGGSDGIFLGRSPHPRAFGTFARYLAVFGAERGDLGWTDIATTFSANPARRFRLGRRGSLSAGSIADLIVVDPAAVRSAADYDHPRRLAEGVDDVFVAGQQVLRRGELTGVRSGIGLRREPIVG